MYLTGNSICDALNHVQLQGNIIPNVWYKTIIKKDLKKPKPYLLAIAILADIVYWYRPSEVRDEITGQLLGYRKRFRADLVQRSYKSIMEMFGCSYDMAKDAVLFLESIGVVRRVIRDEVVNGILRNNNMYLALNVDRLMELTYPPENENSADYADKESELSEKFSESGQGKCTGPAENFPGGSMKISTEPMENLPGGSMEIAQESTGEKTWTRTKNTRTKNTSENTLSINHGIDENAADEQSEVDGLSDLEVMDLVVEELEDLEAVPYDYIREPKKMQAAVHYLCEYEFYQQHPFEPQYQNTFVLCVDCLIEMASTPGRQIYRGAVVNYAKVIDAINKNSDQCREGGLTELVFQAVDDMLLAEKTTRIKNIRQYMKSVIWNAFSTYKVKSDALFIRTFDGI